MWRVQRINLHVGVHRSAFLISVYCRGLFVCGAQTTSWSILRYVTRSSVRLASFSSKRPHRWQFCQRWVIRSRSLFSLISLTYQSWHQSFKLQEGISVVIAFMSCCQMTLCANCEIFSSFWVFFSVCLFMFVDQQVSERKKERTMVYTFLELKWRDIAEVCETIATAHAVQLFAVSNCISTSSFVTCSMYERINYLLRHCFVILCSKSTQLPCELPLRWIDIERVRTT